ncbi:MAG: hypothetical protein AAB403_01395 [Planctomycetota bacterium]
MTDKEQIELFRCSLSAIIDLREEVLALSLALARGGALTRAHLEEAKSEARQLYQPVREAIQKLGAQEDFPFAEILRAFEGPIQ